MKENTIRALVAAVKAKELQEQVEFVNRTLGAEISWISITENGCYIEVSEGIEALAEDLGLEIKNNRLFEQYELETPMGKFFQDYKKGEKKDETV